VKVRTPDAQFGRYLLEQFRSATGERMAALHQGTIYTGAKVAHIDRPGTRRAT
jgi:hypothetical protein